MKNILMMFLLLISTISYAGSPCSGNKGGINHCDGSKFNCNDGSLSASAKNCSVYMGEEGSIIVPNNTTATKNIKIDLTTLPADYDVKLLEDGKQQLTISVVGHDVKNIKIDKITVWDSGNNTDGNGSTANFVSGMMKTVPPLNDLFNMAGLNLPTYLKGEDMPKDASSSTEITPTERAAQFRFTFP